METEIDKAIRELVQQLQPPAKTPLSLMQGVVTAIIGGGQVNVILQGGTTTVAMRYLLDAYTPTVPDVVWIIDAGPAQRFVLGPTRR